MSSEPRKGHFEPVLVDLVAGETYWWGRCGCSQGRPLCHGSPEGSGIEPVEWKLERNRRVPPCTGTQTRKAPICDNTHLTLRDNA